MGYTLNQSGRTGGDCTAPYNVEFHSAMTLSEFIDDVIKDYYSWGKIAVKDIYQYRGKKIIEYSEGKLDDEKTSVFSELELNSIIKSATAHGGYSLMDYEIILED
jgi:hypothetical protein